MTALTATQLALLSKLVALPPGAWHRCTSHEVYTAFSLRDGGLVDTRWHDDRTLEATATERGRAFLAAPVSA